MAPILEADKFLAISYQLIEDLWDSASYPTADDNCSTLWTVTFSLYGSGERTKPLSASADSSGHSEQVKV